MSKENVSDETFDELERRVFLRYASKIASDWPIEDPFDVTEWIQPLDEIDWSSIMKASPQVLEISTVGTTPPIEYIALQFPREQWVTYPARRAHALLIADRLLDSWDDLTPENRTMAALLITYGGVERL